jgi:hypothetical protein
LQKLNKIYRANYGGERITTEAAFQGSEWLYKTEWVPTAVANNQLSKIATIIGNGSSRKTFPIKLLMTHMAGRLGAKSMQTYACNAAYRDITPTFLVAVGNEICDEIASSDYCNKNIVYANSDKILKYPNTFYLVPQDYVSNAGSVATYLACFDGHEKIYLVGFDNGAGEHYNNNMYADTNGYAGVRQNYSDDYWIMAMEHIKTTYNEVEFERVTSTPSYSCPATWLRLPNFRQISFNQYIIEADLGVT